MTSRIDPTFVNAPRESAARTASATDFTQFAALRRGAEANDPKVLREAARQFESLFTKMMLDSMRKASFGDPMFGSDQGDMYQGMMDDQLAVQLSAGKGLGLADMLIRQLTHGAGAGAGAGSAQAAPPVTGNTAKASPEQRQKFIDEILPHATAAARALGVDARSVVAQAALETGWGRSQPGGTSNNLFGIKAGGSWEGASVRADTQEYVMGAAGTENAAFRAYGSVAQNMADYVRLLRDNPRYSAALGTGSDVRAFADALQRGGYATDPAYADKLVAIADQLPAVMDSRGFKSPDAAPISQQEPSRMSNG